jgi:rod shape-determining protein MreC
VLEFFRRNRVLLASAFCVLLAAGLAVRTGTGRTRNDGLGRFFLEVMAPFQRSTAAVGRAVGGTWQGFVDLWRARGENVRLRERTRALTQELERLTEVELENARLRRLLDFREALRGELLTARVIGHDATGLARTLTIDRGVDHGVSKGAATLAPEGIVGQVFLASDHAARILLISDHNSGVDALVQRSRARGIVQGTVDGGCVLKYVKRTDDVQVGDLLVTSGIDGIFPKGLPVGRVISVDKRGQGLFQHAEVQPHVDFDALEEVLVTRGPVEPLAIFPTEPGPPAPVVRPPAAAPPSRPAAPAPRAARPAAPAPPAARPAPPAPAARPAAPAEPPATVPAEPEADDEEIGD